LRSLLIKCLATSVLCGMTMTNVMAEEFKIGVVNSERIMREAPQIKVAEEKINQEFSKRIKELDDMTVRLKAMSEKFDRDAPTLVESERIKRQRELVDLDKDFQRKREVMREDLTQRKNEEYANVLEKIRKVIRQIAEAEKFDVVFQEYIYSSNRTDITDKVINALKKQ
jgi:outer membrane protein